MSNPPTFTSGEARTLLRLLRADHYKAERERVKNIRNGWKPRPGRRDLTLAKMEIAAGLIDKIEASNPEATKDPKEAPHA